MKLLIDTKIILDAMMNREPWAKSARDLLLAVAEEKATGCITAGSCTDLYSILRKHLQDKKQVKEALLSLLALVEVLDVTGADCEKAFELPMADYEDALMAQCGKRHKVDRIVTRDLRHYEGTPVKAVEPEEILQSL